MELAGLLLAGRVGLVLVVLVDDRLDLRAIQAGLDRPQRGGCQRDEALVQPDRHQVVAVDARAAHEPCTPACRFPRAHVAQQLGQVLRSQPLPLAGPALRVELDALGLKQRLGIVGLLRVAPTELRRHSTVDFKDAMRVRDIAACDELPDLRFGDPGQLGEVAVRRP